MVLGLGKDDSRVQPDIKLTDIKKGRDTGGASILVVGTSGTGKTTLLNIYTGAQEKTGVGAQAVTKVTVAVEDRLHQDGCIWLDNPGWSDPDGNSDSSVFKSMLQKMQDEKLYKLKCVIWCVAPQPRMDSTLQAQAKFIDDFTANSEAGRIWTNVVIVAKGKLVKTTVAEDCQGAREAARDIWVHADPILKGWELATQEVIENTKPEFRKKTLRIFTEEEVRGELEAAVASLPPPVQVVFANQRCEACGQTGDPRLMTDRCHRKKVRGHIGELEQRFSKKEVGLATAGGAVGITALASVSIATGAAEAMAALPFFIAPSSILAGHRLFNTSKDSPAPCGPVKLVDMRWSCCKAPELAGQECTDLCDFCNKPWGSNTPCIDIIRFPDRTMKTPMSQNVVIRDHFLVENK